MTAASVKAAQDSCIKAANLTVIMAGNTGAAGGPKRGRSRKEGCSICFSEVLPSRDISDDTLIAKQCLTVGRRSSQVRRLKSMTGKMALHHNIAHDTFSNHDANA